MDVKEFARLGGKARARKLGAEGLKAHAAKMVAARALRRYTESLTCNCDASLGLHQHCEKDAFDARWWTPTARNPDKRTESSHEL